MFIRIHQIAGYRYNEVLESYRDSDGKPRHRCVARWPASRSFADELTRCELAIVECKLNMFPDFAKFDLSEFPLAALPRKGVSRNHRAFLKQQIVGAKLLVSEQQWLTSLQRAAKALQVVTPYRRRLHKLLLRPGQPIWDEHDQLNEAKRRAAEAEAAVQRAAAAQARYYRHRESFARAALNRARSDVVALLRSRTSDLTR